MLEPVARIAFDMSCWANRFCCWIGIGVARESGGAAIWCWYWSADENGGAMVVAGRWRRGTVPVIWKKNSEAVP